MIRQHAYGDRLEGVPLLDRRIDAPQPVDMSHQDVARSVGQSDREKENAALDLCTTITRHGAMTVASFFRHRRKTWARRARARLCPPYREAVCAMARMAAAFLLYPTP